MGLIAVGHQTYWSQFPGLLEEMHRKINRLAARLSVHGVDAIGGSAFGSVVAPPLTAWMAGSFRWRGAFVATGLLGTAWLVIWLTGTVGGCAGIIANLVTGPVVDRHGFTPIFIGMSALYPMALLILLTIPRPVDLAEASEAELAPPPFPSRKP